MNLPAAILALTLLFQNGGETRIAVHSDIVYLPTRVQNKKGDTIYGLKPEQFIVEDNGVRQTVNVDEDPSGQGLSLVLVVQCSRSAPEQFDKLKGLGAMVEEIAGGGSHEVAVISFGEKPYLLSDFSGNQDVVRHGISRLKECGNTHAATIDAVSYAIDLLKQRPVRHRRAILLVSETRDHGSKAKLDQVAAELGIADTVIYSVAFMPTKNEFADGFKSVKPAPPPLPPSLKEAGKPKRQSPSAEPDPDYIDHPPLIAWPEQFMIIINALRKNASSEMASLSGGEYINFTTRRGFEQGMQRISNQIHNYYLLSFQPPSDQKLELHRLRVRIADHPDAVIQTRKSYWSGVLEPAQ